jgi:hypothetical protein
MRIDDNQWLQAVFLKIHTSIHNLNKYNGYYRYWDDNTIYTRQENTHTHTLWKIDGHSLFYAYNLLTEYKKLLG